MNTKFKTNTEHDQHSELDLRQANLKSLADLVKLEDHVQSYWRQIDLVKLVKSKNKGNQKFSFFDGPVTANNPLGVHHAWGRTLKDVVQRHKSLDGFDQRFEYGFDTQGLWVEVEVEKALGFNSKKELEEYGVDQFVEDCKRRVETYSQVQDLQSQRLGMLKSAQSYYTHSDTNVSAIWSFLKVCRNNGWLYKGHRPMPWCPRCGTSLSSHEQADAYKEVTHPSVYAMFPLQVEHPTYLVVWTTTPWTLPANMAVAVHPDLKYGYFKASNGDLLVTGEWLKDSLMSGLELVKSVTGEDLLDLTYNSPFSELSVQTQTSYRVFPWTEVTEAEGTGVVHLAPGCGREDYELLKPYGYQPLSPLEENGVYSQGYGELSGLDYQEANQQVVENLKRKDLLFRKEDYTHRYPHCWRCKTELVYRLADEWFLSVDEMRPRLLQAADEVKWDPKYTKKLFTDWVANMDDWCVSRKRYWGLPLPFYECDCGHLTVVGSKDEFCQNAVGPVADVEELHLPWVDFVQYPCESCGRPTQRVAEVGDCWLDAGVMPFSTLGYFDGNPSWDDWFPADFVCEMREQVRLWFYSMMFLSVTLVGQPPFKQVLSYEMVRDKNDQEMHKSGKNNVVLDDALDHLGADTLRLYYLSQNRSSNMRFDLEVGELYGKMLMTVYHSFRFFSTYADLEEFRYNPGDEVADPNDRWMLSRVEYHQQQVRTAFDRYNYQQVVNSYEQLVEELSSWYLRRVRERVWNKSQAKSDRDVYTTLFRVFRSVAVLLAPVAPFFAELLYQSLRTYRPDFLQPSVHLESYESSGYRDTELEQQVAMLRRFDDLSRKLRNQVGVKLRQPLEKAYLWHRNHTFPDHLRKSLLDLLNVKSVEFLDDPADKVKFSLKPNFAVMGPKFGHQVTSVEKALQQLPQSLVVDVALNRLDQFDVDQFTLRSSDVEVRMSGKDGLQLLTDNSSLLLLDLHMSPQLKAEGTYRDFVRHVQEARKEEGFAVEQEVDLRVETSEQLEKALLPFADEVKENVLVNELKFGPVSRETNHYTTYLDDTEVVFQFS